jgi:hypothetical protein
MIILLHRSNANLDDYELYYRVSDIMVFPFFVFLLINAAMATDYAEKYETETGHLLMFVFMGVAVGAITTHIISRFDSRVPYTVVVFIEGLFCLCSLPCFSIVIQGCSLLGLFE